MIHDATAEYSVVQRISYAFGDLQRNVTLEMQLKR
jgi:hypothetical protein